MKKSKSHLLEDWCDKKYWWSDSRESWSKAPVTKTDPLLSLSILTCKARKRFIDITRATQKYTHTDTHTRVCVCVWIWYCKGALEMCSVAVFRDHACLGALLASFYFLLLFTFFLHLYLREIFFALFIIPMNSFFITGYWSSIVIMLFFSMYSCRSS